MKDDHIRPCYQILTEPANVNTCSVQNVGIHVGYTIHITFSQYIENISFDDALCPTPIH